MTRRHDSREALLHDLRRSHRAERAPAPLRRRLLERLDEAGFASSTVAPSRLTPPGWVAAVAVALAAGAFGALLLVLRPSDRLDLALGPEPLVELRGDRRSALPSQPSSSPGGESREDRPCPALAVPPGAAIQPEVTNERDRRAFHLQLHTFEMATPSCGSITRRYLLRTPPGLSARASVPVMLVLHDTGQSAETMRIEETRWHLDEVAEREGFILVYANAAPGSTTRVDVANSGGWATDEHTHPEVEDDVYLQRILSDLLSRQVIDGSNDVFLLGYGGGALMALDVAARQPNAYAGVAAFMPTRPEAIAPPHRAPGRLSRVLFVLAEPRRGEPSPSGERVPAFARRWGEGLGISQPPLERRWQLSTSAAPSAGVRQLDLATPATGAAAVRVLQLDETIDPFPVAPVGARRRDTPSAPAFDGARQAWAFLSGLDGADPTRPAPPPPEPTFDGDELLSDEPDDYDAPSVVLEEDVVKAPVRAGRQ